MEKGKNELKTYFQKIPRALHGARGAPQTIHGVSYNASLTPSVP